MYLIELKNISKSYGSLKILDNVDICIESGKSYSITGKSGSGKSTLLHILALLDGFQSGTYFLDGKEITEKEYKSDSYMSSLRCKRFGFVFQDNFLIPDYSALDNVILSALIAGENRESAKKRAMDLLKNLSLEDRAEHKPSELSTGERQRVSICRALMNNPDIIFADEPTGSLDEENSEIVQEMLFSIVKKSDKTLVLVTHDPDFAMKCDEVYRISKCRIERVFENENFTGSEKKEGFGEDVIPESKTDNKNLSDSFTLYSDAITGIDSGVKKNADGFNSVNYPASKEKTEKQKTKPKKRKQQGKA